MSDYEGKKSKRKKFPIHEIGSSCSDKPGIMVKNIPLESYHK